jgi:hypothetical protein
MKTATQFRPGFRISKIDVAVLLLGALGATSVARFDESLGFALAFTVAHFFLFCNVLRMARSLELSWAALFVLLAASTLLHGMPSWGHTFAVMLCVTLIFAALQLHKPSYHGIFWKRINPNLPQWWTQQTQSSRDAARH